MTTGFYEARGIIHIDNFEKEEQSLANIMPSGDRFNDELKRELPHLPKKNCSSLSTLQGCR